MNLAMRNFLSYVGFSKTSSPAKAELAPDGDPKITDNQVAAAGRAIVNLFRHWQINDAEALKLLGGMAPQVWAKWKTGDIDRPELDVQFRMVILIEIHKALRCIFSDPDRGYAWIRKPNKAFDGKSALDVMMSGKIEDMADIRNYLDIERGAL